VLASAHNQSAIRKMGGRSQGCLLMTRIIAFANQKGGVAKTTSAVNFACIWARTLPNEKVLFIDADAQANATSVLVGTAFAAGPRQAGIANIKDVLLEDATAVESLVASELPSVSFKGKKVASKTIHVLPAHLELAVIEPMLNTLFRGEYRLKNAVQPLLENYDLVVIDCPPSLGSLTHNALMCAHEIVIPVSPGAFPIIGLNYLDRTIQLAQEGNPRLRLSGVLPTMIRNTDVSSHTLEELTEYYGDLLLPTIPLLTVIDEANLLELDVFSYKPSSRGATAYMRAVNELRGR
jgi:chromosome partitioning protein